MNGPAFSSPISSGPISRATASATQVNPFQVPDDPPKGKGIWLDGDELPPFMD